MMEVMMVVEFYVTTVLEEIVVSRLSIKKIRDVLLRVAWGR